MVVTKQISLIDINTRETIDSYYETLLIKKDSNNNSIHKSLEIYYNPEEALKGHIKWEKYYRKIWEEEFYRKKET